MKFAVVGLLLVVTIIWVVNIDGPDRPMQGLTAATSETQQERMNLIAKLRNEGVFQDLKWSGEVSRLYVGPRFHPLAIDTKTSFVSVAYAYCLTESPGCDVLVLHDGKDGKEIGRYGKQYGGLKMD